jgi:Protein of unknown function (DUF3455)
VKSTKQLSIMKRLLLGTLSLLAIGLLAACGGYDQTTTTSVQNALPQKALIYAPQGYSTSKDANYPDPTDQSALPESVRVTAKGETVLLRAAVVEGYQIYECQPSTTDSSGFAWKLQAPFAFLKTDANTNILHSTGPSWLYTQDGSEIRAALGKFTANGKVVPASATPDTTTIAWLRLDVTDHRGNAGLMSKVDQVQRLYTHGGKAPASGCNRDAANQHVIQPVSYTAEYVFWGHKG